MKIGRVTISDRAIAGLDEVRSGPEIERRLREVLDAGARPGAVAIRDGTGLISGTPRKLADAEDRYRMAADPHLGRAAQPS
jgi:hypothetical protein